MKILYVCEWFITFIINEIVELQRRGNDVYVLVDPMDGWVNSPVTKGMQVRNGLVDKIYRQQRFKNKFHFLILLLSDFLVRPIVTARAFYFLFKLYKKPKAAMIEYLNIRQALRLDIGIIHAPFSAPKIIDRVYLLSKTLKVPFTLAFRAHDIYQNGMEEEIRKRINIINEASQIITISQYNKHYLRNHLGINGKEIKIVHSTIDVDFYKPEPGQKQPGSIISVCRFDEQKGLVYLIKACHILNQKGVDFRCTIIGDGPEKGRCESLIDELQIPNIDLISFLPPDEVRRYLNRSEVFVLPCVISSRGTRDILPNVLKEAMAAEVPVITTNICGIEELVEDGTNGLLVPPEDPEAIAEAIIKLFNNQELRRKLSKAGREKIERDFNTKKEVSRLIEAFEDVF